MPTPKFIPNQKVFYRHVVADDKLFTSRVVEYINTSVDSSRYDEKTKSFYYKIAHPIHSAMLIEVPEHVLFATYKEAINYDRFI